MVSSSAVVRLAGVWCLVVSGLSRHPGAAPCVGLCSGCVGLLFGNYIVDASIWCCVMFSASACLGGGCVLRGAL